MCQLSIRLALATLYLFGTLTAVGAPMLFYFGIFRGIGQLPHTMLLELAGALLSRLWLEKKYGKERFQRLAPVLFAGYLTGVGLLAMATIALRLIKAAISTAPF